MAAYVIADVTVKNPDIYDTYRKQVLPTIQKFGGRFIVRGGSCETLEGGWHPSRIVMIEFPDAKTAKAWYHSDDYTPLAKLRQSASEGRLIIVEGA